MSTGKKGKTDKTTHVTNPQAAFETPMQVVHTPHLPDDKKEKALETWEEDEKALQRASDEGMSGGQHPRLHEVKKAQQQLEKKKED
jgi:hypothetical protein